MVRRAQAGSWVFGVEGDGDWADSSGFGTFTTTSTTSLCARGCLTKNTWLVTARGRAGYAFDRFLVYGTGGVAFGNVQANFSNDPISSTTKAGLTAGAGIEVAVAPSRFCSSTPERPPFSSMSGASGKCRRG